MSKETLIGRALEGDSEALGSLYRQYYAVVERFALKIEPGAPEDRVQLVLLKVLELLRDPDKSFDEDFSRKFTGWLYKVARFVLADQRKQSARRSRPVPVDMEAGPAAPGKSPPELALARELDEVLRTQVEHLPSLYRDVLERQFFRGMDRGAIARELGIDEATVRKRAERAYGRLRASLKAVATTLYARSIRQGPKSSA